MLTMQTSERKLAELILYISQQYANDPSYGSVKLNKALFFPGTSCILPVGERLSLVLSINISLKVST